MTENRASTWPIYKRLLAYAGPYKSFVYLAIAGIVIEAAAGGVFTKLIEYITDVTFIEKNTSETLKLALVIIAIFIIRGFAGYIADYNMAKAGRGIARDFRTEVLSKYLHMPGAYFDREPVPTMQVRLGSDSEQVAQAVIDAAKVMLQQSGQVIACLVVMFLTSWQVTLSVLVMAPPLAWIMDKVGRRYRRYSHRIQESSGDLMLAADESLSNQQEVKVYGAQSSEHRRYQALADHYRNLALKVESTRSISSAVVQTMGAIGLALLLLVAGHEAAKGRLTAGGFVALMLAMSAMIPSLKQLTNVQNMLQRGIASAERLFAIIDAGNEKDTGTLHIERVRGEIEFRHVSVRYPDQQKDALTDISFTAKPGTVTAIIGRSGSGKSTLIKLLPRFYEPDAGVITIDGIPIDDIALKDLRRQIALVGQQVMLFDGTIAENVAYGEMADKPADSLEQAIRGANAMEFVEQLPEGMQTRIGTKGGRLSGGQRQRLAIARAMLKDAPILILDEATAALDNESERLVQDALNQLMPDRTTLVIAHRLSTIENADQVLVLDHGKLVEQGTHQELLAKDGLYSHLYRMQFHNQDG